MDFKIFVEGKADKKFIQDYSLFKFNAKLDNSYFIVTGGWEKLKSELNLNALKKNHDLGIQNIVIFDADDDFDKREKKLLEFISKSNSPAKLFLWPNNKGNGDLEITLENIINNNNVGIFQCWRNYEDCLNNLQIKDRETSLTTPNRKSKIYAYLGALLGESKSQIKKAQEENRDYTNTDFWDLNSKYLDELDSFLKPFFPSTTP